MFLIHGLLGLRPSFVALASAALALFIVRPPIQETLERINWSVLLFFISLFVLVGGLEQAGVLDMIARVFARLNFLHPILFSVLSIWIVAGLSAVVDNIPITIALIPVIYELQNSGINITPLWWALVFGAGFGGNGMIIGSTANIVVVGISERTRTPITAELWNRRGLVIMIVTCLIASLFFIFGFEIFN
jgi:Na+/H+ antiporter NhaD/arsenite permease-like protein